MFAIPDMDKWQSQEIGPYTVTDISGLEPHTVYAVRVRAKSQDDRLGNFSEIVTTNNLPQGNWKSLGTLHPLVLAKLTGNFPVGSGTQRLPQHLMLTMSAYIGSVYINCYRNPEVAFADCFSRLYSENTLTPNILGKVRFKLTFTVWDWGFVYHFLVK